MLAEVQTYVPILSRQEKYRLIEFIVQDLAQEEIQPVNIDTIAPTLQRDKRQNRVEAIDTFVKKWRGCLRNVDADREKYLYLQEKYQ